MNLLLLAYALAFLICSNFVCGCIETEKQVLLHLKTSVVDKHNWLESWIGDDCGSWSGIHCNDDSHVTALDLGGLSLTGDQK